MYTVVTKQTRPNTSVEFLNIRTSEEFSNEYRVYFQENYLSTGKIINSSHSESIDGLETTSTVDWESEEAFLSFKNDTFCIENFFNIMKSYQELHGVTTQRIS